MNRYPLSRIGAVCAFAAFALAGSPALGQVNLGRWGASAPAGMGTQVGPMSASEVNVGAGAGPGADLHLEFPIYNRALPNRAQVQATLVYDSLFWQAPSGTWHPQAGNGWWLRTAAANVSVSEQDDYGACGWSDGDGDDGSGNIYYYTLILAEPDGTQVTTGTVMEADPPSGQHDIDYFWDCPSGDSLPETFYSGDGKGFSVVADGDEYSVTGTAYDGYGDNVTGGLIDLDGNTMTATNSTLTDAIGPAVSISGSNPVDYTYTGPNNSQETIAVGYTSVYANASFGCYNGWAGYLTVPAYIQYPDGSTYTFGYDTAGRLATVTYPGGGQVSYSHSMVVQCAPQTIIESLTKTDSLDGTNSWTWNYNDSAGGNETDELDPDGSSVYTDFDNSGNVTEIDRYNVAQQVTTTLVSGTVFNRTWTTRLHAASDQVSSHTQVIDGAGFTTSTSDTDWGSGSPGGVLQQTADAYTPVGNGEVLTSAIVKDGNGNQLSKTTWTVDSHGNPQSETQYVNNGGGLTTNFTVNANGTIHTITEPNAAVTTMGYSCGTGFYPNSVQTVVGTTTAAWDCNGGVETGSTDLNGHTTSTAYDSMWRPSAVTRADTSVVNFSYPSSGNSFLRSERSISANGTTFDDAITTLDGLGRPVLQQLRQTAGGLNFDTVQTCYDVMSRPYFVTLPYSGTLGQFTSCPSQWAAGLAGTYTTYDGLSRPTKVQDGGGGETDYAYNQNDVLSTVLGTTGGLTVSRQEQTDGLGRLQSVCEITTGSGTNSSWPGGSCGQTAAASGYLTTYAYSYNGTAQGPVTTVTQNLQSNNANLEETRTLQYDQRGRLTSETNPETQQHAYIYTFDTPTSGSACTASLGDLVERQDPNGNTTCYGRDQAHRVIQISYTGPNASVTDNKYFVYGTSPTEAIGCCNLTNVAGRLVEAYTGSPSSHKTDEVFGYTNLGQVAESGESTPHSGGWYQSSEAFWADGARSSLGLQNNLSQNLLPAITYAVDGEGRTTQVADGSPTPPVTAVSWLPYGLQSTTFGSTDGHTDQDTYSFDPSTGRLTGYAFNVNGQQDSGTMNWLDNGEISSLSISDGVAAGDNGLGCSYQHDDMGRLSAANCGASSNQTFTFDPFGNVCKNASAGTAFCPAYNTDNQISGGSYDANGNLLKDNAGATNIFDADGKSVQLEGVPVTFDALGRAVEEGSGSAIQEFAYAPDGAKLAVMSGQSLVRADVPLPGGAEAVYNGSGVNFYRHADLLGSSRLATTQAGTLHSETAFAPFGEPISTAGTQDRSFTGKKQDIANGQAGTDPNGSYDFPAREYSPTESRWWTPDPAGLAAADFEDPQSLNRYAYADCDPLTFVDPSGMASCAISIGIQNKASLPGAEVTAIEARINEIFSATPTEDGNVTTANFVSSGGAYTLQIQAGTDSEGDVGAVRGPIPGFPNTILYAGASRSEFPTGAFGLGAGTIAAHELVHRITGIGDLTTLLDPSLMTRDAAIADGQGYTVDTDYASPSVTRFARLTQAEAGFLYRQCLKLAAIGQGGSGGGGEGPSWWDQEVWAWLSWWSTRQPPDPCPNGDCAPSRR